MRERMARVIERADLTDLSSFKLPAKAAQLVHLTTPDQLEHDGISPTDTLILGEGSNTVFLSDWPGTVVLNRLKGISSKADGEHVLVRAAAGESWHGFVKYCLRQGWYGLENLIMIPGSVGAAPMQNIGAYGVEVDSCIHTLTAWDRHTQKWCEFDRAACAFGYRDSVFKTAGKDRYIITAVEFRLSPIFKPHTHYPSLHNALMDRVGQADCAPETVAATIMRLRRHRLPDPGRLPNAGSFFKNPIVSSQQHDELKIHWPGLPAWPLTGPNNADRVKLSAAWMIEALGFKGDRVGDAGVYHRHALVLVNLGQATPTQLKTLIARITDAVKTHFGIALAPEPQLIDSALSD